MFKVACAGAVAFLVSVQLRLLARSLVRSFVTTSLSLNIGDILMPQNLQMHLIFMATKPVLII